MGCGSSTTGVDSNGAVDVSVSAMVLTDFLQAEKEIAEIETNNPLHPLELKAEQLVQLSARNKELQSKFQTLQLEISSFPEEVKQVGTQKFFVEKHGKKQMTSDEAFFLDLFNEKEIIERELLASKEQYRQVSKEVTSLEKLVACLEGLYFKQDALLDTIFGKEYGSIRENQVEMELDHLEIQRSRILEANFRWRQGQMMLEQTCKQLSIIVKRWQELQSIPDKEVESRYSIAVEIRNNIVAAAQNISTAQTYLKKVQLPYCSPQELATLLKAARYIFTDIQSEERSEHAIACYKTAYKRANALLQWFDSVITTTIMKDLEEINEGVKLKTSELRKERIRLINLKVKEHFGADIKLNQTFRDVDVSTSELARANLNDNQVVKVEKLGNTEKEDPAPLLLSSSELAPIPSNSVIFGSAYDKHKAEIERLGEQHQNELQMFLKYQENSYKKIKGDLDHKLMVRRQRRARKRIEERQINSIQNK